MDVCACMHAQAHRVCVFPCIFQNYIPTGKMHLYNVLLHSCEQLEWRLSFTSLTWDGAS